MNNVAEKKMFPPKMENDIDQKSLTEVQVPQNYW